MEQATAPVSERTQIVLADRIVVSESAIKKHVIWAMGVGLVPIPIVDLAGVTAVQLTMLNQICKIYGVEFKRERAKSIIAALLGAIVPLGVAGTAASLVKFVPLFGTVVGVLTMPAAAGAATYAIGRVFVQHFETGGTLLTFDPMAVRNHFTAEYSEGKKVAADLKK